MDDYPWPNCSKKVWPLNDDIVISGIAGRFPESDNIDELAQNLLNNIDMVTRDERRWPIGLNNDQTSRSGKLKNLEYFDHTYFCTIPILADCMEPGSRIILETTYEAIADAGIAPQQIRGTKTGVYVGINTVANAEAIPQDDFSDIRAKDAAFWVYGSSKALLANRISFLFDLIGPSTVVDTACSASMVALANAVQDLRMGNCEMALVATSNICLAPYSSYVYHSLGLLSHDGKCKVFDKNADGFVRSETVGALFLMRKTMAKRVYATVLHAKTNTDGFKTIGLFAPFWLRQRNLMIETFQEAGIQPGDVDYFESHGTGTNVGDPQESRAVSGAYGQNRKDKLLMGAVKSNLGHTEGASGLCSVAKAIIIFENKTIPANLHYTEPKPEIECLHKTIEPVVENQPFDGSIIGVNSFGVGGVNAHALLRINPKESLKDWFEIVQPIPRLILVCGRTIEAVEHIFDFIQNNPDKIHRDFLALLNDSMKTTCIKGSGNFPYRGYMIIDKMMMMKNGDDYGDGNQFEYKNKTIDGARASQPQQLWLIFTGMGSQWNGMAKQLMQINVFRAAIEHCAMVLLPMGVDLLSLLLENSAVNDDDDDHGGGGGVVLSPVHSFVAITSMQIALYDVIEQLGLPIAGYIGHSFGEIACAYADGCLTASQAILTSYWRGKTVQDCQMEIPKGIMAAVGLTVQEFEKLAPYEQGVYVACHNGKDSITISGQTEPMQQFMERLKAGNIFCRKVMGGDYPYHSVWMQKMAPQLLEKLETIIPKPKRRSVRWITTSIPPAEQDGEEEEGNDPKFQDSSYASGQYFVNNLLRPVYFEEAMQHVPKRSCCLEIAPHSLFQSIFKRCYPDQNYISLMKKDQPESNLINLLTSLGRIYTHGFNPNIEKLYPPVQWPVARGTQSIGALIRWDHSRQHEVKKYPDHHNFFTSSNYTINVSLLDSDWRFIKHHRIDGRCVFPLTGYLWIVWRALATRIGQPWNMVTVRFENVRVCRPTFMNESKSVKFVVQILDQNGDFTLTENNAMVCKGQVMARSNSSEQQQSFQQYQTEINGDLFELEESTKLNRNEIYKELKVRGYDYGQSFRWLLQADGQGRKGIVQWSGHWINFVDSALHLSLLSIPLRALFIPVQIDLLECDPRILFQDTVVVQDENPPDSVNRVEIQSHSSKLKDGLNYFKEMTTAAATGAPASTTSTTPTNTLCGDETIPFEIMNFTFEPTSLMERQQQNEAKTLMYNVKFDLFNQTLITKGLLIQGLVPVNVPRKIGQDNLILERQLFVPLVERKRFLSNFSLKNYVHSCTKLLERFRRTLGFVDQSTSSKEEEDGEEAEEDYDDAEKSSFDTIDEHLKYLKILQKLCNSADNNVERRDESLVGVFQQAELELDILNQGLLYQEAFVRPIMELFAENVQHVSVVRILEICTHCNPMATTLIHHMKMNISHKFHQLEYWLTKHERLLVPDSIANLVQTIDWPQLQQRQQQQQNHATTSKASGGLLFRLLVEMFPEKFDLVIVSNRDDMALLLADGHDADHDADHHDVDAEASIQVLANITKPSGFILSVTYNRTELLPFEQTLRETLLMQCRSNMPIGAKDDTGNIDNNNSLPAGQSPNNSTNNIGWPSVNNKWNIDQYLCNDDGKQFQKIASNIDVEFEMQLSLYRKLNHDRQPEILLVPIDTHMVGDRGARHHFQWIEMLKEKIRWLKSKQPPDVDCRMWIVFDGSKHDLAHEDDDGGHHHHNGIVGFANCLLLELQPYRHLIRILAMFDPYPDPYPDPDPGVPILLDGRFNPNNELVREILDKDLVFNIVRDGKLGTFRYLSIGRDQDQDSMIQTDCAHVSQLQFGDLSSLKWFQSEPFDDYLVTANHRESEDIGQKEKLLCNVYYSALNFKDVVIASGKILPGPESALFDCMIGLEFAGRCARTGQRIMGMVPFKGMATKILTFKDFVWPVPEHWTMEDAATVPIVYVTAYYALLIRGRLKPNEIVLIHSGAGGVGQAALNVCLAMKCRIFVTVGTNEKRIYLKKTFNLDDDHILCSRDCQFEKHIKTLTNGYGVDVVLNSLTGDKLQASLRCLAVNGRFLEIGKWDMQMNNTMGMFVFLKNISFHGIGLDSLFREGLDSKCFREFFQEITRLIQDGIQTGVVKPICRTVFRMDQVEQAFRYMTNGHHIGKVLIRIRPEDGTTTMAPIHLEPPILVGAIRKTWFNPYKVYLIAGGLGGVGLELIYWMIARGARKFMITTRSGIKSAYQRVFLKRFKIIEDFCSDYRIVFHVSRRNIADPEDCRLLIDETMAISDGQQLGGVFNLALFLQDGLFENQTIQAFENVSGPKSQGLYNLHRICEEKCLTLEHFVAFSSFTSGRGNVGQTNYGWANSSMERLIEARNAKDLPGLAIQFGPISDVGVVADQLLKSDLDQDSVRDGHDDDDDEDDGNDDRQHSSLHQFDEETLKSLLGISMQPIHSCLAILDQLLPRKQGVYSSYLKYEQNPNKSDTDDEVIRQLCSHLNIDRRPEDECLGDIGLDSMAAVEIQQRLERDFSISLTLADVRQITVKELKNFRDGNRHNLKQYSDDIKRAKLNLSRLRFIIPTAPVVALNNVQKGKPIYCLPTLIGIFDLVTCLAKQMHRPLLGLNWTRQLNRMDTFEQIVDYYYELIINLIRTMRKQDENENVDDDDDDEHLETLAAASTSSTSTSCDILALDFGTLIALLLIMLMKSKKSGNDDDDDKNRNKQQQLKMNRLCCIDLLPLNQIMLERKKVEAQNNNNNNNSTTTTTTTTRTTEQQQNIRNIRSSTTTTTMMMIDEQQILSDYKVMLIFDYIKLYIPERLCHQSQREVLELNCCKARVDKINELLRKCLGTGSAASSAASTSTGTNPECGSNNNNNVDMAEIIENTYRRASMMVDYQWKLSRGNTIRRLVLKVLNLDPNLRIDYVKFVDKTGGKFENPKSTEELLRKQLKLMFDLDLDDYRNDPQLSKRFRLHLVDNHRNHNDDLFAKLDQNVVDILNDFC